MAYCKDEKNAICTINAFLIADEGAPLFEKSAWMKLHRNPATAKCKFFPLVKWCHFLK